jgi:phosphatidylserine/phosphatidylglycerophosphate/cardiolipin synthase-like enzyme
LSLIVEPRDGVRPVVRWIDRAQTSIFVAAYILTDRSIVRALERAAAQGVQVYVELDPHPFGLPAQPSRMSSQLQAADVHVRWSRPGFTYSHAKYIVIDDRVALIGTANYSVSAFSKNREFILVDRSTRDVLSLSSLFRADWDRLSAQLRDPNLVIAPGSARRQLTGLARSARRTLDVYAEEFADPALEGLFGQMARRVRVRVLLPPGATPLDARRLAASGVSVRSLVAPYSHAKAVLVDGTRGFVGSENMSSTSLDHNREVGVLLPPPLVRKIEVYFARDWRAGRPVSRLSAHREGR